MHNIIHDIVERLDQNQVILYPTDTIRGLGGDATNPQVVERIFDIKKRAINKSVICLMHPTFFADYCDMPLEQIMEEYAKYQGPTTFVIAKAKNLPEIMIREGTIAVRIPFSCTYLMELLKEYGKPIVSTSANIAEGVSPKCFEDIDKHIMNNVDFVVPEKYDGGTHQASTIVVLGSNERLR